MTYSEYLDTLTPIERYHEALEARIALLLQRREQALLHGCDPAEDEEYLLEVLYSSF